MWINQEIWRNPSLWNNFRKIYGKDFKLFIEYRVIIETQKLSLFNLNEKRKNRLELINSLSKNGFNSAEISRYLNINNLTSPRGNPYTPKLIWVTLDKYNNRLRRKESFKIIHKSEKLCVLSAKYN